MTEIIALNNVSVAFGREVIYDRLSFSVIDGEFLCILGPSGCGKSTLLRVVGDLLGVDTGSLTVAQAPASEAWQNIAYVFQSPRLLPWRNAEENVILGQQLRFGAKRTSAEMRDKARLPELVGLGRDTHKSPPCRPAASVSACRSRERWRSIHALCSWTSRSPRLT